MSARALAGLLSLALLGGCGAACPVGEPGIVASLYFGRSMGGQPIGDAAWQDFLARSVTPRFPDGLTVLDGRGQWRAPGTAAITHEPSSVVLIATGDDGDARRRLEAVRTEYRARFAQQSVGLTVARSCNDF